MLTVCYDVGHSGMFMFHDITQAYIVCIQYGPVERVHGPNISISPSTKPCTTQARKYVVLCIIVYTMLCFIDRPSCTLIIISINNIAHCHSMQCVLQGQYLFDCITLSKAVCTSRALFMLQCGRTEVRWASN